MAGPPKLTPAELSRRVGKPPQSLHRWLNGAIPDASTAVQLADALNVDVRWLATGQGRRNRTQADEEDWVTLPHIDLFDFAEGGSRPLAHSETRLRREWLRQVRTTTGLWAADMPSAGAAAVGQEGDTLICVDANPPLVDGRYYILILGGRPALRQLRSRPDGLELRTGEPGEEPTVVSPEDAESLAVVGRVLAAVSLRSL